MKNSMKFRPSNGLFGRFRLAHHRKASVSILVAFLLVLMMMIAVFAVDYGHLLVIRTDLQRAADNATLAAVQDLVPDSNGEQNLSATRARVREYARVNLRDENFTVDDADIEIGRYDPETIYSGVTLLDSGIRDTVRVTLRRNDFANSSVTLMLARLLGIETKPVSATSTAVLQKARYLPPGSDILPIGIPVNTWNSQQPGDEWLIYSQGRLVDDNGNEVPGNWGTLDVGHSSNSNSDIYDQILNGLRQEDLDILASEGAISNAEHIDSDQSMWLSGDTGLSSGMKSAVIGSHGKRKLIPIYDTTTDGNGENLDFHIVGWGAVEIVTSNWNGAKKTYIKIRKSYTYDGDLRPHSDLSNTDQVIDATYTTPILVE